MFVVLLGACGRPAADPQTDAANVLNVVAHDVSPPLRELANTAPSRLAADEVPEAEPVRRIPLKHMRTLAAVDSVVQTTMGAQPIAAPTANFEGLGAGLSGFTPGGVPPDTDGDIGPNHYMEVVNTSLAVFSRTGSLLLGPADTSVLWSGFNGECAHTDDGDATLRYDHFADRWVVAQFSLGADLNGPFFQCVAVSTTPDPTGTYNRYQFKLNAMNDYPKMGLWPDAYYFTFNMFGNDFLGGKVCAMDRAKMLAGAGDATMQCFDTGADYGGLLAADVDGKTSPPPGAPNYLVALNSEADLAYWKLHVDFAAPANSMLTGPISIPVSSYAPLCGGDSCVPQPGTTVKLDSLADRAMNRFVYRRFVDHESLVLSHSVKAGTSAGIRWYELRTPSAPTVFQQGTFAPGAAYRWLPSIAMDGSGNITAIYSTSSTSLNPGIRYAGRKASDPAGTFGLGEATLVTGGGAQSGLSRWGDYASLNIDPVDDCTFWGTHEYKREGGRSNWHTRIASFTLPSCSTFSVVANDAEHVAQGRSATYTINTATLAGAAQDVQLSTSDLPPGVTASLGPATLQSGTATMVTLTADATAAVGATHYTIVAAGTASSQILDVALTVDSAPSDDAGAGSGNSNGADDGGCCRTGNGEAPLGTTLVAFAVILVVGRRRRASRLV
jgi:hypothetical protein